MANVFVLNNSHDFSQAKEFGPTIVLTGGNFSRFATSHLYKILRSGLKDSKPEDFIVISSLTIISVIACAIFALKHRRLNLLLYKIGDPPVYLQRTIDFSDLEV